VGDYLGSTPPVSPRIVAVRIIGTGCALAAAAGVFAARWSRSSKVSSAGTSSASREGAGVDAAADVEEVVAQLASVVD
jgi:hydroxyethylthiazole kinase-like sugar kinase family protein